MEKEKMIQYIKANTPAYQGMEDDFEGLDELSIDEIKNIIREMK